MCANRMYRLYTLFLLAVHFTVMIYGKQRLNAKSAELLRLHNKYRQDLVDCKVEGQPPAKYMSKLRWNHELAKQAKTLASKCILKHKRASSKRFEWVGQNMAIYPSIQEGVYAWFNEHKMFNYYGGKCRQCLHYTQMVWANTTDIGCGVAKCPEYKGLSIVCNYGPGGNWINDNPYEVKRHDECPKVQTLVVQNTQSPPVNHNTDASGSDRTHQNMSMSSNIRDASCTIKLSSESSKGLIECRCYLVNERL
ncbi:Cysteine-rich secretory protein LCCL domain-containing 2 [Schistosoma japonicum]|nr:Cysteine-rich secretory protein LCCL domain-containing 2 [Schistosoma japonicum]